MQPGLHTVDVTFTNIAGTRTASRQFSVTAAQTPVVGIVASSTHITELATPVILTASSTGSGANPLYTFARDKGFTNLLRPEGANAILQVQPVTLTIGDNKIYVRVKTSAACYTEQTDIDSVLLKRDAATGIIDLNDPGRIITASPNPFQEKITIRGLNNSKVYSVILRDSHGQSVYRSEIKNKQVFEVRVSDIKAGIYWLTIYDGSQKLIGTEKMVRLY